MKSDRLGKILRESSLRFCKLPNQGKDEKQMFELFLLSEKVIAMTDIQAGKAMA